jgi:hypothetical protein
VDLQQSVLLEADVEGSEQLRSEVFTRHVTDILIEAGELEEAVPCHLRDRGIEVHGYGVEDDDTVNLISTIYRGDTSVESVAPADINTAFKRLAALWERCREKPYHEQLEESSDAHGMAMHLRQVAPEVRRLRFIVVTDGVSKVPSSEVVQDNGIEIRRSVWDLQRLHRLETSGSPREPIAIDFEERFGGPLPCLGVGTGSQDYDAMLVVFPGAWLADIYHEYGARLLELNVRSFLQATGKVNRGIRDTLRHEPERFLAYNNGISATASAVELVELPSGGRAIKRMQDLQIVNGGQTTASIHRASRTGVDLSEVSVQAKVTVIAPERLDEIVPLISRYANSQNKVSEADLSSNDPFHVEVESLSRTIWTPPTGEGLRQTRWFYERARGQYADGLNRAGTPAQQRAWKQTHPPAQKFTKTDVAKFSNAWDQLPHEVSRGAQKNFTVFMTHLRDRPIKPDAAYFERLIAKAILWKRAEKLIGAQQYGGYRANLVAYAIAKLSHATQQRLDLAAIWNLQGLDDAVEDAVVDLSRLAWEAIVEDAPPGANITEWAKREDCWRGMRDKPWSVPAAVAGSLVALGRQGAERAIAATQISDDPAVAELASLSADVWFSLSNWAKQTGNLHPWERKLAYDIGMRVSRGRPPSAKQAMHGKRIIEDAERLGWSRSDRD